MPAESRADDDDVIEPRMGSVNDEVCPIDRYIARRSVAGPCPFIGTTSDHWAGEKLFGDDATGILGRYCLYEWEGAGDPPAGAITALDTHAAFEKVASDCEAITGEGDVMSDALQPLLRGMFRDSVNRPTAGDLGITAVDDRNPVVVAVIDTVPPAPVNPPRSLHGETMARIIEDVACPNGAAACVVEVHRVLGLPRWAGGYDPDGGVVGGFSDVARAIHETVHAWQDENTLTGDWKPLVINLSLGWEGPHFGGGEPTHPQMDATPAAVYDAIRYASCLGAEVVVAAGNDSGVCETSGPLYPGGWEAHPAPTQAQCTALGAGSFVPNPGIYRPLVHAVGGGGLVSGLMPDTRDDSLPRIISPATHVVGGDEPTPPLTGTSVAAAAVSGAAALVWAQNPALSRAAVMQRIYDEAEPVPGLSSEVRLANTSAVPVRKLDACAVMDRVCKDMGPGCDLATPLACLSAPPGPTIHALRATVDALPVGAVHEPGFGAATDCGGACEDGDDFDLIVAKDHTSSCSEATYDPWMHITRPQPGTIGCPSCTITSNIVTVAVHDCFATTLIEDIDVTIYDPTGASRRFDFGPRDLEVAPAGQLVLDPTRVYPDVARAQITIKFVGMDALTDALIVLD